jgi:diacylglycerol kinase (ATP)
VRLTVTHNPTAGDEEHSRERLTSLLAEAGHEVRYQSVKDDGWEAALASPGDLVVVAGGDGTVRRVFKELAGRPVAVAVLPFGSANNVARTLGLTDDDPAGLARGWHDGDRRPYDVGEVSSAWSLTRFVESVGGGIFAELLATAEDGDDDLDPEEKEERGLELLLSVIDGAPALPWALELDGRDVSGEFLAVEVMNIREIGPNVPLAPAASPGDGLFDIVVVGPDHRRPLATYLRSREQDRAVDPPHLPRSRGRRLSMRFPAECPLHVDDQLWPEDGRSLPGGEAVVEVSDARVQLIHPSGL